MMVFLIWDDVTRNLRRPYVTQSRSELAVLAAGRRKSATVGNRDDWHAGITEYVRDQPPRMSSVKRIHSGHDRCYVAAKATYIRLLHGKIGILEGFFGPSSVHRGRTHVVLG